MKLMLLQSVPWCFQFVSNPISCLQIQPNPEEEAPIIVKNKIIKVVKSDGLVKIYERPVEVREVMMEFPKHMVCRSDSFYIGQKIPPLSENDHLQLGQNYFLLPKHFFQTVLTFVTIASFASRSVFLKKAASCQPFDIQKSPSGSSRIRVSDEFLSQLMCVKEEEHNLNLNQNQEFKSKVCTTPQLQKDYSQLIGASRQWKPKLETIKETEKRKLTAFGIKRRKKSHSKTAQRSALSSDHHHHRYHASTSTPKPSSKTKIKFRSKKSSSS